MTNREWLIEKLKTSTDEQLADIFVVNEPTCSDPWGWQDRYTNPFHRKYIKVRRQGFFSFFEEEEEVYEENSSTAQKDFCEWLNEEHDFNDVGYEVIT